ncbi:MAG TPA: hypothetical protein VJT73_11615, partial [Polyangiaceae bacterium]|nr:hypothetical protein [Polyangiaceae bacterium]
MQWTWAPLCLGFLATAAFANAKATALQGNAAAPIVKPNVSRPPSAKPPAGTKPAKPSTKPSGLVSKPKPAQPKSEPARKSQAEAGVESAELLALREADRELFPPAAPPIGVPWPSDLPTPLNLDPGKPLVHASGLPPSTVLGDGGASEEARDLDWLRALAMPEVPVRWDARVVRYLEYYRDDPRGRGLIQAWVRKSGRYGTLVRRALRERGLPEDLVWVSL